MLRSMTLIITCLTTGLAAQETSPQRDTRGDSLKVDFVLPFSKALERARKTNRLLFIKPIYGGVDAAGAADYRRGTW